MELPKEDDRFWGELRRFIPYDPGRTLLGRTARPTWAPPPASASDPGVHQPFQFPASAAPRSATYLSIHYFSQLIPGFSEAV